MPVMESPAERLFTVPVTRFGMLLKDLREKRSLSQADLADKAGLTHVAVGDWERGKRNPRRVNVEAIAEALEVSPDDLLMAAGFIPEDARRDPLLAYGEEVDPKPYLYALRSVQDHSAGIERMADVDAPGEDHRPGWPVRCIKVKGSCMEPFLKDGEVAMILPPDAVTNGCIVTATVDIFNAVCKRVCIPDDGPSYLEPTNGEGHIPEERFVVTGVVAHKISPLLPPPL